MPAPREDIGSEEGRCYRWRRDRVGWLVVLEAFKATIACVEGAVARRAGGEVGASLGRGDDPGAQAVQTRARRLTGHGVDKVAACLMEVGAVDAPAEGMVMVVVVGVVVMMQEADV